MSSLNLEQELRRGWRVLVSSCVGLGLGLSGLTFFTFGMFVVPLAGVFGWSRSQIAAAASALVIGSAITAPLIGIIIDRYGARRVSTLSLIGVVLGYVALTQINGNITTFYVIWFVLALAGAGTTPVVWTRAVSLWFDRGRGLALGITLAGAGLASIFGPPFCQAMIRAYGWQAGYLGLGAVILIAAVPAVLFLFEDQPPRTGTTDIAVQNTTHDLPGLSLREAIRTVQFWKIGGGFFVIASTLAATLVNIVPMLIDRGIAPMPAAQLAGLMGIAIVIGRVGLGWLVDRYPPLIVATGMLSGAAFGCLLLVLGGGTPALAAVSVILIGLAVGAEIDLVAYLSSRYFGMRAYGKIYGCQTTFFYVASAGGQFAIGVAYDHFHSYGPSIYLTVGAIVLGMLVIASLGRPPSFAASHSA